MKVLFVQTDLPYPCHAGGHFRDLQHLQLARKLDFDTHLFYASARQKTERELGEKFLKSLKVQLHFAGSRLESGHFAKIYTLLRKLKYLACGVPWLGLYWARGLSDFPFSFLYDALGFKEKVVQIVQQVKPDVVVIKSYFMHFIPELKEKGYKIVADCPDINEILALELLKSVPTLLGKLGPFCNWMAQRRHDQLFLPLADEIWTTSIAEKNF